MSRIDLHNVNVTYELMTVQEANLKRRLITGLGRRRRGVVEPLAALDDINLLLRTGTRLGVIGPNGAGKSTLLRVLAGALPPTRGQVRIEGTVLSLLGGPGAGLDYSLSGYENVIMSGLLLGESASAMRGRTDEIAEFSGLGDRLHNPISTYSSGMLARLRFSILTSLRPQILIMDEGVATADRAFTQAATARLREFQDSVDILVMSAHGASVADWADMALWLDHGRIIALGDAQAVTAEYFAWVGEHGSALTNEIPAPRPFIPAVSGAEVSARPLFVLGNPRTGSTLLSTLLLQHPEVHIHGELFHPNAVERQSRHALRNRAKAWFDPETDDPLEFLDTWVFAVPQDEVGRQVSVVGVKVFADHVQDAAGSVFPRLREHYPDAVFVHVLRSNYLDVLISKEIAVRGKRWVDWTDEQVSAARITPFEVDVNAALAFFAQMHQDDAEIAALFAGPGYLAVEYEDLVADLPGQTKALFAFLGLPDAPVSEVTRKQVRTEHWDLVRNADDLRQIWARFAVEHGVPVNTEFSQGLIR